MKRRSITSVFGRSSAAHRPIFSSVVEPLNHATALEAGRGSRVGAASLLFALPVAVIWPALAVMAEPRVSDAVVEIRSYNLKPGTRDHFHQLFEREALPLLQRFKIDVVAYGPSLHDDDSYFLMRSFSSVEQRQRSEDAFYEGTEWRLGPREAILDYIASYTTVLIRLDDTTLRGLRRSKRPEPPVKEAAMHDAKPADLATLLQLNGDYIRSVQTSDVQRFKEILAEDFRCSLPDGSLIDRERFLERMALPATISNLEVHDVDVRSDGGLRDHSRSHDVHGDGREPGIGSLH